MGVHAYFMATRTDLEYDPIRETIKGASAYLIGLL